MNHVIDAKAEEGPQDVLLFTSDFRLPKGELEAQTFGFPHNLDLLIDMSNMGSHFLPRETISCSIKKKR